MDILDKVFQLLEIAKTADKKTLNHILRTISAITADELKPIPDIDLTKAIKAFVNTKEVSTSKTSVLTNNIWEDEENGILVFQLHTLVRYLGYNRMARKQLIAAIYKIGGGRKFIHYEDEGLRCWYVPAVLMRHED